MLLAALLALLPGCASQSSAPAPIAEAGWVSLFDGRTLAGWKVTDFPGHGAVHCESGTVVLDKGTRLTGITWTNEPPEQNYEIELEAMRVAGSDFFCGLTVPVNDSFCSFIVGGWGGSVVGISSLDGLDASENETSKVLDFQEGKWYRIRLRITEGRIEAWIDQEKVVDAATAGKRISLRRGDIELSKPFGIASWQTTAALREIKMRRMKAEAGLEKQR